MVLREVISAFSFFKLRRDDDFVDRLHYFLTTNILIALSILVSFKQFGGKPIECAIPDILNSVPSAEQYIENYCWAKNTYFIPWNKPDIPEDATKRTDSEISYYQWVPFFLLLEAAAFYLPHVLWDVLASQSGLNIANIVEMSLDPNNMKKDNRQATLDTLTNHLENALRFHKRLVRKDIIPHKWLRCLNFPYSSKYVTCLYLVVKIFFLINVIIQFKLLNTFLETGKHSWYGFGAIADLLNGTSWETSGLFPLVTLCDFNMRVMGSTVNRWTSQCVLVINLFNEKIFVFLWFWFFVLMVITLCSLIWWALIMLLPWPSRNFVSLHMELCEMPFDAKDSEKEVERFVSSYLKQDGVFVLRMLEMHNGVIFAAELLWRLWALFYGIEMVFLEQNGGSVNEKHLRPKFQWIGQQIIDQIRRRHCLDDSKAYSEPGVSKETVVPPPPVKSLDSVDGPRKTPSAPFGVRKIDVTVDMDDFADADEKKPLKSTTAV